MAKPIEVDQHKKLTLEIRRGPGLHQIEHIVCSPSDRWFKHGVDFFPFIPYNKIDGRKSGIEFPISLIPTALSRLDIHENIALDCHFNGDIDETGEDLSNYPPIKIIEYSVKSRKGIMRIDYDVYCRLIEEISRYQF